MCKYSVRKYCKDSSLIDIQAKDFPPILYIAQVDFFVVNLIDLVLDIAKDVILVYAAEIGVFQDLSLSVCDCFFYDGVLNYFRDCAI